MGQQDALLLQGFFQNDGVSEPLELHFQNVDSVVTLCPQESHSVGRDAHIREGSHARTCASSNTFSSASQAAYRKTCRMSSTSRYVYAFKISASDMPLATKLRIREAVTRVSRMHARPPITSRSKVIRSKPFITMALSVYRFAELGFDLVQSRRSATRIASPSYPRKPQRSQDAEQEP